MAEKKASWDYFDFDWCKKKYPETEAVFNTSSLFDPEEFLMILGKYGYSPNPYFDEKWYISRYPDVVREIKAGNCKSGFDHYRKEGYKLRNPHWLFDEEYYITLYKDTRTNFINGYDHYITKGDEEFRAC